MAQAVNVIIHAVGLLDELSSDQNPSPEKAHQRDRRQGVKLSVRSSRTAYFAGSKTPS
jgi:hypothetical protein